MKIADAVTDIVVTGEIVAASADEDAFYGSAAAKIAAMEIPYLTNRNINGKIWKTTDPQM